MQNFINNIVNFFVSIYEKFIQSYNSLGLTTPIQNFLDQEIFAGNNFRIVLTYRTLLMYVIPMIMIYLILYLIIRFLLNLVRVITK